MSVKVTWYGHAVIGLDTSGYNILVDPFFTDNPAVSTTAEKVAPDYILVSHGHGDHVGDTIAIDKHTNAQVIANAEIAGWLGEKGVNTHPQHLGGGYHHPFGYLKLTLALHGSGLPDDTYGGNPAGFLLTTKEDTKIYLACDTGLFGDMELIGDEGVERSFPLHSPNVMDVLPIRSGKSRDEVVASDAIDDYNAKWGGGFMKPDVWIGLVYDSLRSAG